jgi:diguanylate cyclase (GGDEF)-like protein
VGVSEPPDAAEPPRFSPGPVESRELLDNRVRDPDRLRALHATELLEDLDHDAFDRLARLGARVMGTKVALVSLVDADRQVLTGATGLPEPWSTRRETPRSYSFCEHVVARAQPLAVEDARADPVLRDSPAVRELGAVAYAGFPLIADGHALGAVCALDDRRRRWGDEQLLALQDLAGIVMAEIDARLARGRAERAGSAAVAGRHEAEIAAGELEEANRDLSAVVRVTRALAREPDARLAICEAALDVAGAQCSLLLEPIARGTLAVSAAVGVELDDLELSLDGPAAGAAQPFRTGRSRLFVNAGSDPALVGDELVRRTRSRSLLVEPVNGEAGPVGLLAVGWDRQVDALTDHAVRLVGLLVDDAAIAIERAQLADRLSAEGRVDRVTRLPNRHALDEELPRELLRCRRLRHPLCLALIDLEGMPMLVRREGSAAADHLLAVIGERWGALVRDVDLLARDADDRFAVVLPACAANAAVEITERLRGVAKSRLNCSIGVAAWDGVEDHWSLRARAEDALRTAARAGPDSTAVSPHPPDA